MLAKKPRSVKTILNYASGHSKIGPSERGIALTFLDAVLNMLCLHLIAHAFDAQVARLEFAGFLSWAIASIKKNCSQMLCALITVMHKVDKKQERAVHQTGLKDFGSKCGIRSARCAPWLAL